MHHFSSATPASLQRRSRTFWVASWLMVLLYLVASGRAFIPGICATQRALDAQCSTQCGTEIMRPVRACCVLPPAGEGDSDSAPVAPGESGCALCKLVSSMAPLAVAVHLPAPPALAYSAPQARTSQRAGLRLADTFQNRAPPLSTHLV